MHAMCYIVGVDGSASDCWLSRILNTSLNRHKSLSTDAMRSWFVSMTVEIGVECEMSQSVIIVGTMITVNRLNDVLISQAHILYTSVK